MTSSKLPVWKTLGAALDAPLSLPAASWQALIGPLLTLIGASALAFLAGYWKWGLVGWALSLLLGTAAAAWFGFEFQRHLLLGSAARDPAPRAGNWRRYGLYLLVTALAILLIPVLSALLLSLVFPTMAWFQAALAGSDVWFVSGWVLLSALLFGAAAYPVVRLLPVLPALAVDHDARLPRIWKLSRGNGLRLLVLLLVIPGCARGLVDLLQPRLGSVHADAIAGVLLNSYLIFVHLALIALSYRALSGQALPPLNRGRAVAPLAINARLVRYLAAVACVGLLGAAVSESVFRVEPGETAMVVRFGKPQRIESRAGLRLKIPLIEQVRPIFSTASYRSDGDGRFLTFSKEVLPLRYHANWRVANAEIYFQATGGETWLANARIGELAEQLLRSRIVKLSPEELRRLLATGSAELSLDGDAASEALLGDVLEKANESSKDFGIEITKWRVEVAAPQAG